MKSVYLIAGNEMHQSLVTALEKNGFNIVGYKYTLDAAVISLSKIVLSPDLFIINGLAQVSGNTEGVINRNRSMILKLRDIRIISPQSRVLLILPSQNPSEVIRNIISLGIYDIHQTSQFDESTLLSWIDNPMSIANFSSFNTGQVPNSDQGEIKYESGDRDGQQNSYIVRTLKKLQACKKSVKPEQDFSKLRLKEINIRSAISKLGMTVDHKVKDYKITVVLGLGNENLESWFLNVFCEVGKLEVVYAGTDLQKLKKAIESLPDIVIVGRKWSMGGIADADIVAREAAKAGSEVIFIAGELDHEGKEMVDRLKAAGIVHIISCQPETESYISGEELVFIVHSIIRDIENREQSPKQQTIEKTQEPKKETIRVLKNEASLIGQILMQEKSGKKKAINKFIDSDGIPLEDKQIPETLNENQKKSTTVKKGGLFAVVSPWRPGLAGRLAAQAVKMFNEVEGSEVAFISASKDSTGALWLDTPDDELMMSDWRVPGSNSPIERDGISLYVIDPSKDICLNSDKELWEIVKSVRKTTRFTVMDCGGDINVAQKCAFLGWVVLLFILPGGDPVEMKISQLWLKNIQEGKRNIVVGIDLRNTAPMVPEGIEPKIVIRNNPADALSMALKRDANDEFRLD